MSKVHDWTPEEDDYLTQGNAICPGDFKKMVTLFRFKPNHTPQDLQDHWRDLIEIPLSDDQDIIGKLKSSTNKFKGNIYNYSEELEFDIPNFKELEETYMGIPSVAAKSLTPEMQTKNVELQNINSLSLHCYFTADRVEKLVNDAFNRVVDDENLKITLYQNFKKNLIERGRKIYVDNMNRILSIISKMDEKTAEIECAHLENEFERIFLMVQRKIQSGIAPPRMYDANTQQELVDAFNTLKTLTQKITWPMPEKGALMTLHEAVVVKCVKLYAYFLTSYCTDAQKIQHFGNFIDSACRNDPYNLLESYAPPHLKAHIAQIKQNILSGR